MREVSRQFRFMFCFEMILPYCPGWIPALVLRVLVLQALPPHLINIFWTGCLGRFYREWLYSVEIASIQPYIYILHTYNVYFVSTCENVHECKCLWRAGALIPQRSWSYIQVVVSCPTWVLGHCKSSTLTTELYLQLQSWSFLTKRLSTGLNMAMGREGRLRKRRVRNPVWA